MPILPTQPMVNKGNLYIDNVLVSWVDGTHITVSNCQARDSTNINDINLLSGVTINTAVQGANGLDQGTIAVSTKYYVFVIGNSCANDTSLAPAAVQPVPPIQPPITVTSSTGGVFQAGAALLSLSATAPALPTGYDMFRNVGSVLTSGAGAILNFTNIITSRQATYYYSDAIATAVVAGNATVFTAVNVTAFVPLSATSVFVEAVLTSDAGGTRTAAFRATGSASVAGQVFMSSPASTVTTMTLEIPVATIAGVVSFDYLVSNAAAAIALSVTGYRQSV